MDSILDITFPEKFNERYQEYRQMLLDVLKEKEPQTQEIKKSEDIKEIPKPERQDVLDNQRPRCVSEDGIGYLQFSVSGEKIEIGGAENQPFRLLQCLIEPLGTARAVELAFEAIREGVKKKSKIGAYTQEIDKNKKVELIKGVIKELQKGKKLKGKLKFEWDALETKLWLKYIV